MADILLVDAQPARAESLRALLKMAGHTSHRVLNGQAALEALRERPADLVVSDVILSGMTGYEMCRAIKDDPALRHIPVILLTTLSDPEEIVHGLNARADSYLARPFDPGYLIARVRLLLAPDDHPPTAATDDSLEVELQGKRYTVHSGRRQMLNLLVSTYENAIHQTRRLTDTQLALEDLTERISHDRNLLRTLIDTLPDSIYVKDASSRYLLDNTAHMRLVGARDSTGVVGRTAFDFFPPELAERYHVADQEVMRTGEPVMDLEEPLVSADGTERWVSTTKMPFHDEDGSVLGLVCMGRDITEKKHAQQQLAAYADELRRKNEEMLEDLNMARELQQAFLPQQALCFPREGESALRVSHHYLPSTAIGGDFFEPLWLSRTHAGLILGDVMGHGVRAALVTSILRGLIEELRPHAGEPAHFMGELNRGLVRVLGQTRIPIFSSAFYLIIDTATGLARYANAGHPSPLLLRDGEVRPLPHGPGPGARPGTALGVLEDSGYTVREVELRTGDRLLLFTDGVFEIEGEGGELYDESRLLDAVRRASELPTDQLFQALIQETRTFSITRSFDDDMCLVGIDLLRVGAG